MFIYSIRTKHSIKLNDNLKTSVLTIIYTVASLMCNYTAYFSALCTS